MKYRFVILHGCFGSPTENWFPWLAAELRDLGQEVFVPRFPTPENQSLESWTEVFGKEVGALDENTILIGHSLGVGFALNLLERADTPIRAAFLVSGFIGRLGNPKFDEANKTFVCREFDWAKIRTRSVLIRSYNSDNDPYIPLEVGRGVSENLNSKLTVLHNAGHINTAAGFTEFPQLLADIRAELGL